MKFIIVTFVCSIIFFSSCIYDSDDCICTAEFRMITVVVKDEFNNPVTGLNTTVKDNSGKTHNFPNEPNFFPGHHTVMDDSYVRELTILPKRFIFSGSNDSLSVAAEFLINTDECNCHVYKTSGADTLVLR